MPSSWRSNTGFGGRDMGALLGVSPYLLRWLGALYPYIQVEKGTEENGPLIFFVGVILWALKSWCPIVSLRPFCCTFQVIWVDSRLPCCLKPVMERIFAQQVD